ncbi:hypothetical protein [Streptomyces alkaliterrae]|uniref:Uncharacterized protein n=1 Tax=Streptomyces alkaliterrae TaxID=2213162 RepID=A0A5P0YRG2_9ACTN|nr:hypothetical protein [Streptomyces alkaliterrae]MBB1257848.1 hypothetical protein [Streptomyces alkaliterrae]MQS01109.1 hypothetical protein [Streptomyces alkaliterrae]
MGHKDNGAAGEGGSRPVEDPLMYVLTDEPVPEEKSRDAAFMRDYRAAGEDVALLRADLDRIGQALCRESVAQDLGEGGVMIPAVTSRVRRRWALVVAAAVVVSAGIVVAGGVRGGGQGEGSPPGAALTEVGQLACAEVVAEGTVVDTEPEDDAVKVTLVVDRYYKPERGERTYSFSAPQREAESWTGSKLLVLVPQPDSGTPSVFKEGEPAPPGAAADEATDALVWGRGFVTKWLEESLGKPCPVDH